MNLTLQVASHSLLDEEMHDLTRQLAHTISSETDISAQIPEQKAEPGNKGDLIDAGKMILNFVTSNTAGALVGVLKSFFDRTSNFSVDIKRPDGSQINISAQNMKPEQIEDTVARLNGLLGK